MTIRDIFHHLTLSLVPWLLGSTLGGITGYGISSLIKRLRDRSSEIGKLLVFIPWRTFILFCLILIYSPLIPIWLGVGNSAALTMNALLIFLLAIPMTILILGKGRDPHTLPSKLVSAARTLASSSILATMVAGLYSGAGGIGIVLIQHMNRLEYERWANTSLKMSAMILFVDLILGIPQYYLLDREES